MMCLIELAGFKSCYYTKCWTLERERERYREEGRKRDIFIGCGSPVCQHFITAE